MGQLGDYGDHFVLALDMGSSTRRIARDSSCRYCRLVLCGVSLTQSMTNPLINTDIT
jgi:hypothetical protein